MNDTIVEPFAGEARTCRKAQAAWSRLPMPARWRPVRRFRRLFVEEADRIYAAVTADVQRPAAEVLITDILPTADAFRFLERSARSILRPRTVSIFSRPLWLWGERDEIHRRPHGVVGIIGTWNYPIYLNAIQIVQALTASNGVLWKPSELTQETAVLLHALLMQAGYPADLAQRLPATRQAGPQLVETEIDHLVFTGSAAVGRKLAARLGERLISSTLELSGCDAMFVLADADVRLAAKAAWFGVTLNKGQTCLAIRRMFVDRAVYPSFLESLRSLAKDVRPSPLVLESQVRQARQLIQNAVENGARLLNPVAESPSNAMRPAIV